MSVRGWATGMANTRPADRAAGEAKGPFSISGNLLSVYPPLESAEVLAERDH